MRMSFPDKGREPAIITTGFEGKKYLSLHPRTEDDLPNHVKGNAYWVEFRGEGQLAYHVRDEGGLEYPVEFLNNQWYQLTWGACYAQALGVVEVGSLSVELFVEGKGTQRSSLLSCLSRAEPRRLAWL